MSIFTIQMLVADGSRTVQRVFRDIAAESPLPVELTAVDSGRECARMLASGKPDLAFIDINLPDLNGIDLVRAVRQKGIVASVTLMSTAASMPPARIARELGVFELLAKPFAADEVLGILENYRRLSAPMTALIVDDSSTARSIIRKVLAGSVFHMHVEEAADGQSALASCTDRKFDLIFLDCNMPGLNGLQTLQRLLSGNGAARVIMMSGERNEQRARSAIELGAAAFLDKPFFPADIDRAVHCAFDLRMSRLATAELEQRMEAGFASLVARKAKLAVDPA